MNWSRIKAPRPRPARLAIWLVGLAGCVAALPSWGQPTATSKFLTEAQAVAQALSRYPNLEVTRQRAIAAEVYASTASMMAAPVLKFSTSDTVDDVNSPTSNRKSTVGLEWSPPRPGEVQRRRDLAQSRRDEASWIHAMAQDRLETEVRKAYVSLGTLDELLALSQLAAISRESQLQAARTLYATQRKPQSELHALEMQLDDDASARDKLQLERNAYSMRLATLLGESPDTPLRVTQQGLDMKMLAKDGDASGGAIALSERRELKALAARCAGVDADTALRESGNRPWLRDVQVSYTPAQGTRQAAVGVQLAINLPVVGAVNGASGVMVAERAACGAEQAALQLSIRQEVSLLRQDYAAARRELAHWLSDVLPLHEQAVSSMQEAYAAGRVDEVRLRAVELRQLQAIQAALRRQMALRLIDLDLARASGNAPLQ